MSDGQNPAMPKVMFLFADGDQAAIEAEPAESILAAAHRQHLKLASDCEAGDCQTCRASLLAGNVDYDEYASISLTPDEVAQGEVLLCVAAAQTDATVRLPYSRAQLLPEKGWSMGVTAISRLSASTMQVRGKMLGPRPLVFFPGQYANLKVPSTSAWRTYSMANAPEQEGELEFLVRLLDQGVMSSYLIERAQVGDRIELRGPCGVFYLRETGRPLLMVAGGTGIAPMASMLRHLLRQGHAARKVTLCFGVNTEVDLFYVNELSDLASMFEQVELRVAIARPDASWQGRSGFVTELFRADEATGRDIYLCGPPGMIDAARRKLHSMRIDAASIYTEQFVPTSV